MPFTLIPQYIIYLAYTECVFILFDSAPSHYNNSCAINVPLIKNVNVCSRVPKHMLVDVSRRCLRCVIALHSRRVVRPACSSQHEGNPMDLLSIVAK